MLWQVYSGGILDVVANEAITIDDSKYSASKNSSSGKYYRLSIKNAGVSDAKKYRCGISSKWGGIYNREFPIIVGR
jgi:hypothetical protein